MNILKEYCTHDREPFFALAKTHLSDRKTVLDAGAGSNSFCKVMGRTDIHILDSNPDSISKLKKKYKNARLGKVEHMPYGNNVLDGIHCSHVVEHLTAEGVYSFMQECNRCLRKGGVLVISAPLMWSGFYRDLSHTRPYYPDVFINYLCGSEDERTRPPIGGFGLTSLQYRYSFKEHVDVDELAEAEEVDSDSVVKTGFTLILTKKG